MIAHEGGAAALGKGDNDPLKGIEHPPLSQSRETGGAIPPTGAARSGKGSVTAKEKSPFAKSWSHFVAGGIGGMTAAALTAPLDVLKTRLQSDLYQQHLRSRQQAAPPTIQPRGLTAPLRIAGQHLSETFAILGSVYRQEGPRALFKGLGPNLVGVVPARSINFFTYGNSKQFLASHFNYVRDEEPAWVHLVSAVAAGITTSTATNPIWLVKTRLQLDKNVARLSQGQTSRKYRNSWDCIRQVVRDEGVRGLYKGMSASYLGVAESTFQWVMYERLKAMLRKREESIVASGREKTMADSVVDWTGNAGAAGGAKLIAAVATYPHEVARTRLRQAPMADGRPKYTGLVQCFRTVWLEEGMAGLYGGMTPHLLRTVPSAAIMFGMYEGILLLLNRPEKKKPSADS